MIYNTKLPKRYKHLKRRFEHYALLLLREKGMCIYIDCKDCLGSKDYNMGIHCANNGFSPRSIGVFDENQTILYNLKVWLKLNGIKNDL